jgi:hypothetical protein
MDDKNVLEHIDDLANEEHALFEKASSGDLSHDERQRMESLKVTLDQCWDLLRQRRARRSAGLDPDDAAVRPPSTVERYTG